MLCGPFLRVMSALVETRKAGRPSKFKPELVAKLLAAIADGLNIKQACMAVGIGETTLHSWAKHPELEQQLEEARERCRAKALARIKAAGEAGDWRASEAFLRMSFPADYRRDASYRPQHIFGLLRSDNRAPCHRKILRLLS